MWAAIKLFFSVFKWKDFFSNIFQFVVKNWKPLAIAGLIGIILYQNLSATRFFFWADTLPALRAENAELKRRIEETERDMLNCAAANDKLTEAIKRQNENISQLGEISDKIDKQFAKIFGEISVIRNNTNKKVDDILDDPTPKTCEEALQYLRDGIKDLKW